MKESRNSFILLASTKPWSESLRNLDTKDDPNFKASLDHLEARVRGFLDEVLDFMDGTVEGPIDDVSLEWSKGLRAKVILNGKDPVEVFFEDVLYDPFSMDFVAYSTTFHEFLGDGDPMKHILRELGRAISNILVTPKEATYPDYQSLQNLGSNKNSN